MAILEAKVPTIEKLIDENGNLTLAGRKLFQQIINSLQNHEDRIVVLEP